MVMTFKLPRRAAPGQSSRGWRPGRGRMALDDPGGGGRPGLSPLRLVAACLVLAGGSPDSTSCARGSSPGSTWRCMTASSRRPRCGGLGSRGAGRGRRAEPGRGRALALAPRPGRVAPGPAGEDGGGGDRAGHHLRGARRAPTRPGLPAAPAGRRAHGPRRGARGGARARARRHGLRLHVRPARRPPVPPPLDRPGARRPGAPSRRCRGRRASSAASSRSRRRRPRPAS